MSVTNKKPILIITLMLLATLGLAACSGSAKASHGPVDVTVTLTEFTIEPSLTEFKVGVPYHFTIDNTGSVAHEFEIMPPANGQLSNDQVMQMRLAGVERDQLPAGGSTTLDYTFTQAYPSGSLEFACHLPGHYDAGMHVPIIVTQ
ncbi:MAG: cupredoxin domain-containing protein [Anaerolineales bacterium]